MWIWMWRHIWIHMLHVVFAEPIVDVSDVDNLQTVWKQQSTAELLDTVHSLQRSGKYASAESILDFLLESDPENRAIVQFEVAKNWDLQEKYEIALEVYEDLYQQRLPPDLSLNVAYRRALMYSNLGYHQKAVRALRWLRYKRLSPTDRRGVNLAYGSALLMHGNKKGIHIIQKNLQSMQSAHEQTWLQARARFTLCSYLLQEAQQIGLFADDTLSGNMDLRSNLILDAEKQLRVIMQLQEPEYALRGVEAIGDALILFYDDMVQIPPPDHFTHSQQLLFTDGIMDKAAILAHKSLEYYQEGANYASQLAWVGSVYPRLQRKSLAVKQQLYDAQED